MKYFSTLVFLFFVQFLNAQNEHSQSVKVIVTAPLSYQSALFNNYTYYHHLEDSVGAERRKQFELDSNYKEESMEFTLNGKKYYGYDGGLIGYYMRQCWEEAGPIIKRFVNISEVIGCGNGTVYMADGKNDSYYYYHCLRRVPNKDASSNLKNLNKSELVEVRFYSSPF